MLTRFATAWLRRVLVPLAALPLLAVAIAMTAAPDEPTPFHTPVRLVTSTDTIPAPPSAPGLVGVSAAAMEAAGLPIQPAALTFSTDRLMVPVAGVRPEDLINTFTDARSGGRTHNAIDIMAPKGTPVVAIADGRIARKHTNRLGGRVLYLQSPNRRYAFYYAHLDQYAPGIEVGSIVQQGDTLGTVGNTGNARYTPPHLHFQVIETNGRSRGLHRGRKVNPYTLFQRSRLYDEDSVIG